MVTLYEWECFVVTLLVSWLQGWNLIQVFHLVLVFAKYGHYTSKPCARLKANSVVVNSFCVLQLKLSTNCLILLCLTTNRN